MQVECPFLHVLDLQCAAGGGAAGEPTLLAIPRVAPREVPSWPKRAIGEDSAVADGSAGAACNLGSRGVSRRSSGGWRFSGGTQEAISATPNSDFDHHGYGPTTSAQSLWWGERLLLSARLRLCNPAVLALAPAQANRDRGN